MVASDGTPEWYYLTDALGSVTAMVKQDGTITRYAYEPYGQQVRAWIQTDAGTVSDDGSESNASLSGEDHNPWRYASGYADKNSPMIKFGTRYYMPELARWTQTDPEFGEPSKPLTLNKYIYAGDSPINKTDPNGREFVGWECVGAVFGTIGGAVGTAISATSTPITTGFGIAGTALGAATTVKSFLGVMSSC
jgi:RHS repeat-associated protein